MSAGERPPGDTAAVTLDERLRAVAQGDAVSIGAVSILSRGDDDLVEAARGARDARRDHDANEMRRDLIARAVDTLRADLRKRVAAEGYVVRLEPVTYEQT